MSTVDLEFGALSSRGTAVVSGERVQYRPEGLTSRCTSDHRPSSGEDEAAGDNRKSWARAEAEPKSLPGATRDLSPTLAFVNEFEN